MIDQLQPFSGPDTTLRRKMNELIRSVNGFSHMVGDRYIRANRTEQGTSISLCMDAVLARVPRSISGSTGKSRLAYCKADAGASTSIACYLDTDLTGNEITVECSIAGGGNLNEASPRLTEGLLILVTQIGDKWYALAPFQATADCDCV